MTVPSNTNSARQDPPRALAIFSISSLVKVSRLTFLFRFDGVVPIFRANSAWLMPLYARAMLIFCSEEKKMTNKEIERLVEFYGIQAVNGQLGIYRNVKEAKANSERIRAAKPEILAWLKARDDAAAAALKRREETFNAIPGVAEVVAARRAWIAYKAAFDAAMDSGDGIYPAAPKVNLKAVEEDHPIAVWALEVKRRALYSQHYEISRAACKAYEALQNGANPDETKVIYDEEIKEIVERHIWD